MPPEAATIIQLTKAMTLCYCVTMMSYYLILIKVTVPNGHSLTGVFAIVSSCIHLNEDTIDPEIVSWLRT